MFLKKLFGTSSQREIKKISSIVNEVNQVFESLSLKSDEELVERTKELKKFVIDSRSKVENSFDDTIDKEIRSKKTLEAEQDALSQIMIEAFAMVKETCRRMIGHSWRVSGQNTEWNMVPYDVQILGAIVLHNGKVAEMKLVRVKH